MSLYNMVNGVNPATFFILPMLGKHPDDYPRFRDCFTEDNTIHILTRAGGGNRADYVETITALRTTPGYIDDYDEEWDSTYATFVFAVPEQWKEDYEHIMAGNISALSEGYRAEMCRVYPKLREKFESMWSRT